MQNTVPENRKGNVNFTCGYNKEIFTKIAKVSGSKAVRESVHYIDTLLYYNKQKVICESIEDKAFYAGTKCKKHFRLYEIAVDKSYQGCGYGRIMMKRIISICKKYKLEKITLRTSKDESAVNFYKKFGGIIVGEKGNDYEMEIKVCFTS